jgi:FHA domain-containing protein
MNTTRVAGRLWSFGARAQRRVKQFFDAPLDADARPLEIREAMLDDVERQVTPVGGGRRVFPYATIVGRVAPIAGGREACEATFADFEVRVRARLQELRCDPPRQLDVRVVVLRETPPEWQTGRLFAIDYRNASDVAPVAHPRPARPVLHIDVIAGAASQTTYTMEATTILVGRGAEQVDASGSMRRNQIVFLETSDGVTETVGRAHARLTWDGPSGTYRLFDEGSSNGTHVVREGTTIRVPPRDPRGVRVRRGDEVRFGRAVVRLN